MMVANNTASNETVDTGQVALTMGAFSLLFLAITSVAMMMIQKTLS